MAQIEMKDINQVKKRKRIVDCFWKQCVVFVALIAMVISGYSLVASWIEKQLYLKQMVDNDFSCIFQIDDVMDNGNDVFLKGWAFKLGVDAQRDDLEILLYDIEDKKIVSPMIERIVREDVNQYFLCEYDYSQSGFITTFESKKLDINNKTYQVLISDKDAKKVFKTETYISKGKLMYTNPKEFIPLQVEGTALEQVVTKGALRVYLPDVGMYVYQYEGELYWIANNMYKFDGSNHTEMICHIGTTQKQLLPEYRVQYGYDNLDFIFEEKLVEDNIVGYTFVKMKIPVQYAITKFEIGHYDNESYIWQQGFYPLYIFDNK